MNWTLCFEHYCIKEKLFDGFDLWASNRPYFINYELLPTLTIEVTAFKRHMAIPVTFCADIGALYPVTLSVWSARLAVVGRWHLSFSSIMYIGRHPHGEHYLQPFLSHIFKLKTGCSIVDLWIPTNQLFVRFLPSIFCGCMQAHHLSVVHVPPSQPCHKRQL